MVVSRLDGKPFDKSITHDFVSSFICTILWLKSKLEYIEINK